MDRFSFHKTFKTVGPVVLPVVHVLNETQAGNNIDIAIREGAQGVFLINHDFNFIELLPILVQVRKVYPSLWIGVNFLGVKTKDAFIHLSSLCKNGCEIDGYWADNAGIDERVSLEKQVVAEEIKVAREASGWKGLYFGGTAFKFQRSVDNQVLGTAAEYASRYMEVVTTSGSGTGIAANIKRITDMRKGLGDKTLAIASGVTPQNASNYAPFVDCFLVATGISRDFHNFDPFLVRSLVQKTRSNHIKVSPLTTIKDKEDAWYLSLMSPVTSLNTEITLDPKYIYVNGDAFSDLVNDIASSIQRVKPDVELIVGVDESNGIPLAIGVAAKLKKGFVSVSKETKTINISDSTSQQKSGLLSQAIKSGTSVAVVETCVDEVDVMNTVIGLLEQQEALVTALAAVCVMRNQHTSELCEKYNVFDVIPSNLRDKYNQTFIKFC